VLVLWSRLTASPAAKAVIPVTPRAPVPASATSSQVLYLPTGAVIAIAAAAILPIAALCVRRRSRRTVTVRHPAPAPAGPTAPTAAVPAAMYGPEPGDMPLDCLSPAEIAEIVASAGTTGGAR
jgi:hypothetical protein